MFGTELTLSDQWYATIETCNGTVELHDCNILNGGGRSFLCGGSYYDPYHIDMTGNYWGTDSADQIAEWIWDATDNPELDCTVDYSPFEIAVGTESHSWSEVKALFEEE